MYPYSQLTEGEQALVHDHPHWKVLIGPVLAGVLVLAGAGYLATRVSGSDARQVLWIVIGVLAGIALLWLTIAPVVRWWTTHFVITDKKIMFREGVIKRSGMNIPLRRIASVRYEHDLNDRIFGCGSLVVDAMSDEPLRFTDIPHVENVHALLYEYVDSGVSLREPKG